MVLKIKVQPTDYLRKKGKEIEEKLKKGEEVNLNDELKGIEYYTVYLLRDIIMHLKDMDIDLVIEKNGKEKRLKFKEAYELMRMGYDLIEDFDELP